MTNLDALPGAFPEVKALLRELVVRVRTVLGDHLVGVYLFGSLSSGDFDLFSDIDLLVVTEEALSERLFSALEAMHDSVAEGDSYWATQLEVSYIPRAALRRYDPADKVHPHIDRGRGERLHMMSHDEDWIIQRHMLRKGGQVVMGPSLQTLIDPVTAQELRGAALAILRGWMVQFLEDPAPFDSRGWQSYVVLTLCRVLYTLEWGRTGSKLEAWRWALENLERRWTGLIERAWAGRQNPGLEPLAGDVRGTLDFIRYALESSRWKNPGSRA